MHTPRFFPFGRLQIDAVLLSVASFSWIAGCGSSDPASTDPTGGWGQAAVTHTGATDDAGAGATTGTSLASDGGGPIEVDAGPMPVQSYRSPDAGGGNTCAAPNVVCTDDDAGTSACVAVSTDPGNCGACGNACMGDDATCIGGQCACSGIQEEYCDTGCVNIGSDSNNCGACGNACDTGQICNGGTCQDDDDCCASK